MSPLSVGLEEQRGRYSPPRHGRVERQDFPNGSNARAAVAIALPDMGGLKGCNPLDGS